MVLVIRIQNPIHLIVDIHVDIDIHVHMNIDLIIDQNTSVAYESYEDQTDYSYSYFPAFHLNIEKPNMTMNIKLLICYDHGCYHPSLS